MENFLEVIFNPYLGIFILRISANKKDNVISIRILDEILDVTFKENIM